MRHGLEAPAARAQEQYGFERLGPVVAYFLHDLNAVLERLATQRGGQTLFVSRGGLLIWEALQTYRNSVGVRPEAVEKPFYVSRFLAAKAASVRAPDQAAKILDQELRSGRAADYLARIAPEALDLATSHEMHASFSAFMAIPSAAQEACRDELMRQSALFERYLGELMGEKRLGVLVDTGWQGTIQATLRRAFGGYEFWGANFGRYNHDKIDPWIANRIRGLAFDSPSYDPSRPLSAIIHHRHLIEALFEPVGASIERLEEVDGTVRAVGEENLRPGELVLGQPSLFGGVLRFLREEASRISYTQLCQARDEAARRLAEDILFPSADTARLLGGMSRSADFGADISVPVLIEPGQQGQSPEERINTALWKQGQIALECRPAIARERQRGVLPKERPAPPRPASIYGATRPKVAIIMRTYDRMIFLRRAFESVARQSFDDYVLVIFNDGGDVAGVEEELRESRLDRRRVVLLDGIENRGMEAASNAAIRACDSEYIVIHDDDDSWLGDFLHRTVDYLDRHSAMAGVITHSNQIEEEISGDRVVLRRGSPYNTWLRSVQLGELLVGNTFPPISFVFRRSIYDEVGGFNEHLPVLGDWDFNLKVAARAEIGVIPQALAQYHHRVEGRSGTYANSITGGSNLHERFNTIVRSSLLREETLSPLSGAMVMGPLFGELRGLLRRMTSEEHAKKPIWSDAASAVADDRWCGLQYLKDIGSLKEMDRDTVFSHVQHNGIAAPPDFDAEQYLRENPDVATIVREGKCPSGYVHYVMWGRFEGRRRTTRATLPESSF